MGTVDPGPCAQQPRRHRLPRRSPRVHECVHAAVHPVWGVCVCTCGKGPPGRKPRLAWRSCLPRGRRRCCVRDPGPAFSWEQCSAVCLLDPALATVWSWGQNGSLCDTPCCQRGVGDSHPDFVTQKWWDGGRPGSRAGQTRRASALPAAPAGRAVLSPPRVQGSGLGGGHFPSRTAGKWQSRIGAGRGACVSAAPRGLGRRPWVPREWQGPTCLLPPPSSLGSSSLAWDRVWPPWLSSPHSLTRSRDGPVGTEASEASEA